MRPHRVHRWLTRALTVLWLTGAAVGLVPAADAGQERYDYDALGRLIRVIDEQGRVTEYVYDAAGNLLQVITGGTAQAPTVTAITPTSIRLSNADTIDNTIGLTVKDTTVATVSPASLTIPAGQTEAQASITGLKVGQTALTLTSVTLGTTSVPIFVTTEFRGLNTSVSALLGVVKQQTATPAPPTTVSPLTSASLGVVLGNYIKGLNPNSLSVGTGPTPVVSS